MDKPTSLDDWKLFAEKGDISKKVPVNIAKHWQRSLELGVLPKNQRLKPIKSTDIQQTELTVLVADELEKTLRAELLASSTSKIAWVFTDINGTILRVYTSSTALLDYFEKIALENKRSLAIESCGTQGIALAMELKNISICNRFENYAPMFHQFITVGSPLYNVNGEIIGYIGLFSHHSDGTVSTLETNLRFLVQNLDNKLRLHSLHEFISSVQQRMEKVIMTPEIPKFAVTGTGELRLMTPEAVNVFNIAYPIKTDKLDDILKAKPSFKEIASNSLEENDKKITITLDDGSEMKTKYSKSPIFDQNDRFIGVAVSIEAKNFDNSLFEQKKSSRKKKDKEDKLISFDEIVGSSLKLQEAKKTAKRVAKSEVSVLLMGESGTGKEVFAQSVHTESDRRDGPFISLNCAAIPKDLAESELFGYTKGAFTGALSKGKIGKLEAADGGTIFLDEIGEMPVELQPKLLRALESRKISRIGENDERPIDIRVIAATNRDLKNEIQQGNFRSDLYYRIAVSSIKLPSLKESPEDIPTLFDYFLNKFNDYTGKNVQPPSFELYEMLKTYPWYGNIRELRNTVEYCVMMNPGNEPLTLEHLPGDMRIELLYPMENSTREKPESAIIDSPRIENFDPKRQLAEAEANVIKNALKLSDNNVSLAAKMIGYSRATIYRKIKKLKDEGLL
jgi:transcriptional regulator with PAS, ATPase and Fis domain